MKNFIKQITATVVSFFKKAGKKIAGSDTTKIAIETIQDVFDQALSTATAVLTAEGTQELAIAAAQSFVMSQVKDPHAQAACNAIIAQAVPTIAEGIQKIGTKDANMTLKERVFGRATAFVSSQEYANLLDRCVKEYTEKIA